MSFPKEFDTVPSASVRRERFFNEIGASSRFSRLFDHIDRLSFFAKDASGALMVVDHSLLLLYGLEDEMDIVGLTDFDLLPASLAEKYRQDDLVVMETGEPLLNMMELFLNPQGIPGWFRTNKMPVFSHDGSVIGVMGTIESMETLEMFQGVPTNLRPALRHIDERFRETIAVGTLADLCGVSVRQLERQFREHFNTPPQQFVARRRIYEGCQQLRETHTQVIRIAIELGFYDHSSFTRQFRKHMGMTPMQYRKRYR